MKRILGSTLYGLLFAAVSPIILYVVNQDNRIYVSPFDVINSLLFSLALYLVLFSLACFLTRRVETAGLIATILVLGFLYLWPLFVIIVIVMLLIVVLVKIIWKTIKTSVVLFLINALCVVFVGFYVAQFILILGELAPASYRIAVQPVIDTEADRHVVGERPDIYYIILDGYGRADMLDSVYGYDNSSFIKALEERGFIVPRNSRSNYPQTPLSLSSSLNMQYLDTLASEMGDSFLWWPLEDTIQHSQVRKYLERQGYKTVVVASDFDYTDIRDGDVYEKPFPVMLNNFEVDLLDLRICPFW